MTDIKAIDVTDPEELADRLDKFASQYAQRIGDYEIAFYLYASADWLRKLAEDIAERDCGLDDVCQDLIKRGISTGHAGTWKELARACWPERV